MVAVPLVAVGAERVSEEVEAFRPSIFHRGFRLVERQPKLRHHRLRPRQSLNRRLLAEDDEVISVVDDVRPEGFAAVGKAPMLEEAIHVNVGKQRAGDPTLWRAAFAALASAHAPFPVAIPFFDRRAKSTVSRELRRNALSSGRYSPLHAAGAYQLRRRREAILEKDQKLRTFVCDRLAEGWTPEQIAGWLKAGNERGLRALGFEAIYAFIYRAARKGEFLWRYLTRRHKRRRPRRARPSRDTIKDRASIHDRPKDIEARADIGHWEGDLIICKRTRPMLVLHERKSRVMLAAKLTGKTAAETISVMLAVFGRINPALRKSITFDNDTAFAQHTLLRTMRDMATWFCDAYASWQKGGVENANGRLRRWLPRHIDIDRLSDEEIQDIVITANLTPRKCLGFKTPFQGILKELGKDVQIRFS